MYRNHRWNIVAFECNPDLASRLSATTDATVLNQAMWTNSGSLEFFLTQETTCSSVFRDAGMGKLEKRRVEVPSIDFAAWLRDNTRPDDFVVLKLDVEGAEYPIIDHLLKGDAAGRIDILFIEFHNAWVNIPKERDESLLRQLRARGIRVEFARSKKDGDWFARPWWP
jgi:FkbM family methyltransferase